MWASQDRVFAKLRAVVEMAPFGITVQGTRRIFSLSDCASFATDTASESENPPPPKKKKTFHSKKI